MAVTDKQLMEHDREVIKHIEEVRGNIGKLVTEIDSRARLHDASKLEEPERSVYAENSDELAVTKYGTPEYDALLQKVKPAIDHHYSKNRHHPEHWPNGVKDMDLIDVLEMIADWSAATKRNKDGNIHKSIQFNGKRFKISPQLRTILTNTVNRYF